MAIRRNKRSPLTRIRGTAPRRPHQRRLLLEPLEDRRLLAAVTVGNASDTVNGVTTSIAALIASPGGDGISLREAVLAANATAGADTIGFAPTVGGAINVINGQLSVTDHLDIKNPNVEPVKLSGPATLFHQFTGGGRILDIAAGVTASVTGLTFENGDATSASYFGGDCYGGAIRNAGTLTVRQCLFYNNGAGDENTFTAGGGAISNSGALHVVASSFAANYAVWGDGGAIYNAGTATVSNNTFTDNYCGIAGGAIYSAAGAQLTATNNTLVQNGGNPSAIVLGLPLGSHSVANSGTMTLNNTIVDGTTNGSDVQNSGTLTGSHNFIGDGSGALPNTLTGDPMLRPIVYGNLALLPKSWHGGPTFTLPPLPGSPCIDAGSNGLVPATLNVDQRGAPRIINGAVDRGAVETGPIQFVVTTLADENDGTADPTVGAGLSLREALAAPLPQETTITFAPSLAGTFALTSQLLADQLPSYMQLARGKITVVGPGADVLTLDGQGVTRILDANIDEIAFSGLTFANGSADFGGAIHGSAVSLTNCVFVGNTATSEGGAVYGGGMMTLTNCTFSGNNAGQEGGAVYAGSAWATVTGCTFSGNSALRGGAIENDNLSSIFPAYMTVINSAFIENSAQFGGAIDSFWGGSGDQYAGLLQVFNSTFYRNAASVGGGAVHSVQYLTLAGNTFSENAAPIAGGIIEYGQQQQMSFNGAVTIGDNIVANNVSGLSFRVINNFQGPLFGGNNLVEDGTGNLPNTIVADPLLGPLQDNGGPTQTMALLPGSPAIDAGGGNSFPSALPSPTNVNASVLANVVGALPANTTFTYRVAAVNAFGETLASTPVQVTTGSNGANAVEITWDEVPGARGYRIYGRTQGSEQLIGRTLQFTQDTHLSLTLVDHGTVTPAGALPTANTTAGTPSTDQRGSGFARVIGNAIDVGAFELQTAQLAGDYNRNGTVDAADYVLWRKTLGTTGVTPYKGADGDGNSSIQSADYNVWRSHFGQSLPGAGAGASTVASQVASSAASAELAPSEPNEVATTALTPPNDASDAPASIARPAVGSPFVSLADAERSPLVSARRDATAMSRTADEMLNDNALLAWLSSSYSMHGPSTEDASTSPHSNEDLTQVDSSGLDSIDEIFAALASTPFFDF